MLESKQHEWPVYMEIVNLVGDPGYRGTWKKLIFFQEKPKESEKAAPKTTTETATDPDVFCKVKNALQCATHPGSNQWCFVCHNNGH
jgi:hypothetical protein